MFQKTLHACRACEPACRPAINKLILGVALGSLCCTPALAQNEDWRKEDRYYEAKIITQSGTSMAMPRAGLEACDAGIPAVNPRRAIVRHAMLEWAKFSFPLFDLSGSALAFAPTRPWSLSRSRSLRLFRYVQGREPRLLRLGHMEDDKTVSQAIASYWTVTQRRQLTLQNRIWRIAPDAGWVRAWSAAFVSWVMCRAGQSQEQFGPSPAHARYVDQAIDGESAFEARDLAGTIPFPGDIVCADMGGKLGLAGAGRHKGRYRRTETFKTVADRKKYGRGGRPMHCDIIVKTDLRTQLTFAIGGNVKHAVSMTVIKLNGRGKIVPTAARPWFALLTLKGDRPKTRFAFDPLLREAIARWRYLNSKK